MVTVIPQIGSRAVEAADWSGCGATSIPPVRISEMISAAIDTAISPDVLAPIGSPTGVCTRAR